ncbi:MAG: polysaccharide deacetylase family protein [Oscillospiraceae bacterium]
MAFYEKDYRGGIRPIWIVAAAALVLGAMVIFVLRCVALGEGSRLLPIYSVETQEKKVAVTFNCAWDAEDIPALLEILGQYDAKATFFILGQWAEENPSAVKAIAAAGHEIATHSNTHPDMTKLGKEEIINELTRSCDKIEAAGGGRPTLFRAPSGAYNNDVISTAAEQGFMTIQWDVDSRDWKEPEPAAMAQSVIDNVQNGSIILLHSGAKPTPEALPKILDALSQQGYEFVRVSDLILTENYTIDHEGRQHSTAK